MHHDDSIRSAIAGWFTSLKEGDNTWRDRHVSRDPDLRIVGTDPEEWLSGEPAFAFLKGEAEAVGGKLGIETGAIEAFSQGEIGWGVVRPSIRLPSGRIVDVRWSAVFRKEDGAWMLVQLHASIGVPNAEFLGDGVAIPATG